jgi:hypothetical protein
LTLPVVGNMLSLILQSVFIAIVQFFIQIYFWKIRFQKEGKIVRKPRNNKDLKIIPDIVSFVKQNVRLHPTITLWELSKLVDKHFSIKLHQPKRKMRQNFWLV